MQVDNNEQPMTAPEQLLHLKLQYCNKKSFVLGPNALEARMARCQRTHMGATAAAAADPTKMFLLPPPPIDGPRSKTGGMRS
jgi:hypothetical protein